MLPDGVVRTPMGTYVLRDDVVLSRMVVRENRLDTRDNIVEIASFAHLIPEGGVVIDAGACLGDHTLTYSQIVGAKGRVYAFEPHPVTYEALVLNMARLNNVATFQLGLSDKAGQEQFNSDPNAGASYVSAGGPISIRTMTLDNMLPMDRCDFIHLDAEGREPAILRGGMELISVFHPALVVEVCDKHLRRAGSSEAALLQFLGALGYDVRPIPSHVEPELRDVLCVWKGAA